MMSFSKMSIHVNQNKAARCVDVTPLTLLASLPRLRNSYKILNAEDIWPDLRRIISQFMKVGGIKTCKELTIGVQQLVTLLFNNNFIKPGLVLIDLV